MRWLLVPQRELPRGLPSPGGCTWPGQARWEKWQPCPGGFKEAGGCSSRPWERAQSLWSMWAIPPHTPIPMPSWPPAYLLFCLPLPAHQPVCRSAQPPAFWSCWLGFLGIYVTCLPGLHPTCPPADFLLVCRPVADLLPAHLTICWLPFCLPVCL